MFSMILSNTPTWVWILLVGLIALGLSQSVTRVVKLRRVIIMSLVMTGLSLAGALSAFGVQALVTWLPEAALTVLVMTRFNTASAADFDAIERKFRVPGSWVPLALIMGIFLTKYAVGVTLAMRPQLTHDLSFASGISAMYGMFSGVFMGRGLSLLSLAVGHSPFKQVISS